MARAPAASSAAVRDRFRRQGRRDTAPELALRRRLHARGVRFRVDVRPGRGTRARGDLVWKGRRLVVFVDGCFWHGCPTCGHLPKQNAGWRVLRFWEHQDPDEVADAVCRALGRGLVTRGDQAIP
ncbi:hypothetical protein ASG36_18165 [Geodermatophilus sp. Leaf369]|nr:hypothetical protein ASG36_18165 [Geodermatophilus sp. Leaf369]